MDAILTEFDRCGVPVLLTTVAPPPVLATKAAGHVGVHETLAERHRAVVRPFFPAGVLGRAEW